VQCLERRAEPDKIPVSSPPLSFAKQNVIPTQVRNAPLGTMKRKVGVVEKPGQLDPSGYWPGLSGSFIASNPFC